MPDDNQPVSNTYIAQGVSDPPNGGQVTSVSPSASDPDTASDPNAASDPSAQNQPSAQQPQAATQPAQNTVSNTPPAPAPAPHPAVQRASLIKDIATTLAGGQQYKTTIDPNTGESTRTAVPLSGRQIGIAIALEALSGGLSGLAAKGSNATGEAAAAGLQQGQQIAAQKQQAQQQSDQQAQAGFDNQQRTLAQRASTLNTNSKIALNASQAQNQGVDAIQKMVELNKPLLDDAEQAGIIDARNLTHDELLSGMQSGKMSALDQLGPVDGMRVRPDGVVEPTHAILNPDKKLSLSSDKWNEIASWGIPGWPPLKPGTQIADGFQIPARVLIGAQEQVNALHLASNSIDNVRDTLTKSDDPKIRAMADNIPDLKAQLHSDTGPGLSSAMLAFQRYESHSNVTGLDTYEALQRMGQPSIPDPNHKGQFIPNPDAKFAPQVASAFGGWDALKAYHDESAPLEIKSPAAAADMLTSNPPGSRAYRYAAAWQRNYAQQQGQDAAAKKSATGGTGAAGGTGSTGGLTLADSIGQGKVAPERISQLLSRNPKLLEEVTAKYPDFDSSKVAGYVAATKDYVSGKVSVALNAGGTALQHLQELQTLNTPASHIPGTPAYTAYQNKVDTVADELAKFYGNSTVSGIESYKKTLNSTLPGNRDAAIRTQAQSMGAKMDSYETTWKNAAPSAAYQAPMPGISDKAKAARAALDPSYKGNVPQPPTPTQPKPQGAASMGRGSDGQWYWLGASHNVLGQVR